MKLLTALLLGSLTVLLFLLTPGSAAAQTQGCMLTPGTPPAVPEGGTATLTAVDCGTLQSCSVTGLGTCTVNGSTVTYSAVASGISVGSQSRGCAERRRCPAHTTSAWISCR